MTDRDRGGSQPPAGQDAHDVVILARYLVGVATAEQQAAVEERLARDAAFRARFAEIRLLWDRSGHALETSVSEGDTDTAWSALAATLFADSTPAASPELLPDTRVLPIRRRYAVARLWREGVLAASVLLAIGLGIWQSGRRFGAPTEMAYAPMWNFTAAPGKRLALTLADGSKVVLAPGSQLLTRDRFRGSSRDVFLNGRAYFEITRDTAHPFLVHAAGTVTRVLGTKFDVRAYPGASRTDVVVRSGRVSIRPDFLPDAGAKVLTRGQRGSIDTSGTIRVESGLDPDAMLAWTTGTLRFERMPLQEVVPELEGWFDLKIRISDPALGKRRLTATFGSEPLDVVLQTIAELVNGQVKRDGSQVIFSPRRKS